MSVSRDREAESFQLSHESYLKRYYRDLVFRRPSQSVFLKRIIQVKYAKVSLYSGGEGGDEVNVCLSSLK